MIHDLRNTSRRVLVGLAFVLAAAPAAAQQSVAQQGVAVVESETVLEGTRYQTYELSDALGGTHEFTVAFDDVSGDVLSTAGDDGLDALLGSAADRDAALDGLYALVDSGVERIVFTTDGNATSSDPTVLVVPQSAGPADDLLPAGNAYDAVTSFPMPDAGRALLFWQDGALTEGRVFASGASGAASALGIVIEIDCDITWTPDEGLKIHCTVKIRFTADVSTS